MRRPSAGTRFVVLALTALALGACSSGTSAAGGTSSHAAPSPSATPTPTVPALDSCIAGTWSIDPTSFDSLFSAAFAKLGADVKPVVTHTGTSTVTYRPDGTFSTSSDMTFTLTVTAAGQKMVVDSASTGTTAGTWSTAAGVLTQSVTSNDVTSSVTLNGKAVPGASTAAAASLPTVPVPVTCSGDTLTMTPDVAAALASASPSASIPADEVPSVTVTLKRS